MKNVMICVIATLAFPVFAERQSTEPIKPIEPATELSQAKVDLGKTLWFDPRLSKSGAISCNSCHNLARGGTDNMPSSIGHGWELGPINSPTVLNSDLNIAQFWDGRAADLIEQAGGPIENPLEMASNHDLAVRTLSSIPEYRERFKQVYGGEAIQIAQVTDAIAEFEKSLRTPNSPFDLWLKGDDSALTDNQKEGYALFKAKGCIACHSGELVGGQMFQKMGLMKPYMTSNTAIGRAAVTGSEEDKFVFKVPTLRNIDRTYPYFHDGSVWDLKEAVKVMADVQLNTKMTDTEASKVVDFLKSLTGELPTITVPNLPPSGVDTPRPNVG